MSQHLSPPTDAAPPRFFWRRSFALIVDWLLAAALSALVLLPFLGNTDRIRLSDSGITLRTCYNLTSIPQTLADVIAPKTVNAATLCNTTVFGIPNGSTATLIYDRTQSGAVTSQRTVRVPIDANGNPVAPFAPQGWITLAVLIAGGGFLLRRSGQTPGKWLLGLHVRGSHPQPFKREILRFLPIIIFEVLGLAIVLFPKTLLPILSAAPWPVILFAGLVIFAAIVWYYLYPLVRWRGALRHDTWTGQHLNRT